MNIHELYASTISNREEEVLQLIAAEHTSKGIATKLFISDHTVISHRKNLMEKMGAKNTAGLVRRGFEYGMLRITTYGMILLICFCSINIQAQEKGNLKEGDGPILLPETIGLEVAGEHAILFGDSLYGIGEKMLWLPKKGAFRAGSPQFFNNGMSSWDSLSIGRYSTSFGEGNKAQDVRTMAWGGGNQALRGGASVWGFGNIIKGSNGTCWGDNNLIDSITGTGATLWGTHNVISGWYTTAWGEDNMVYADGATAWGKDNNIDSSSATFATIWGEENTANGELATSWGRLNEASGIESTTWGVNNTATGVGTTAIGAGNEVNGFRATAIGFGLKNQGAVSLSVGQYNDPLIDQIEDAAGIVLRGTPLLTVGNGGPLQRSNAFTVMDNGRVKIGNDTPMADLHIKSSDNSDGAGVGGIRIESEVDEAYWQVIYSPNNNLNFIRDGNRKAYIDINGRWNQVINFPLIAEEGTFNKNLQKSPIDITKIQIGISDGNNQKLAINPSGLLKELPGLVNRDEAGNPESIDYNQINLLTLQTTKDQAVQLQKQQQLIENLILQLETTNNKLNKIEKSINK